MESTKITEVDEINYELFDMLADELIIHILSDASLGFLDVCRFGKTCKRNLRISHDQKIWQKKLIQVCPYVRGLAAACPIDEDWRSQCIKLNHMPSTATMLLGCLPHYQMDSDEVPYMMFIPLGTLCTDNFCHLSIDLTLRNILEDAKPDNNLCEKYYAKKALRYITHSVLKTQWKEYLALPPEKQHLEDGAILFAGWCQPYAQIKPQDVKAKLNEICNTVKEEIACCHGDKHPACQKYEYDGEHIPTLSGNQCKQVLGCINTVLYKKLGFHGNTQDYYNEQNSNINQVLENRYGIPITLSIVYESIARRLGLTLKPVNFPSHFLLLFDMTPFGFSQQRLYIDAYHEGKQRTASECQMLTETRIEEGSEYFSPCASKTVFLRMANNLIRLSPHSNDKRVLTALELFLEIKPGDVDALIMLARFYVQMKINLNEILTEFSKIGSTNNLLQASLITFLMERAHDILAKERSPPNREEKSLKENPEVTYSVGLVMKHKRYNYNCVIYGWDPTCDMSEEWKQQMGVPNLPHKDEQPFYNVLVEDGSHRYAAQENLEHHPSPIAISHPEVGKYFDEFNGHHYVIQEAWQSRYTDDAEVTLRKAAEQYGENH